MAAPCLSCGGPLPSLGRVFATAIVIGAAYGAVIWWLASKEREGYKAAHEAWKRDLLEAIKAGAVTVIDRPLAERGPPLSLDDP